MNTSCTYFDGSSQIDGFYYTKADVLRELCQKNEITQIIDIKDNNYIYLKNSGGKE